MADAETWRAYYKERATFAEWYLPDPDELQARIALLRQLKGLGLHPKLIGSIMVYGSPRLDVVLRMVGQFGAEETWRRCESFVEEVNDAD
jgi:hypothetical protein